MVGNANSRRDEVVATLTGHMGSSRNDDLACLVDPQAERAGWCSVSLATALSRALRCAAHNSPSGQQGQGSLIRPRMRYFSAVHHDGLALIFGHRWAELMQQLVRQPCKGHEDGLPDCQIRRRRRQ